MTQEDRRHVLAAYVHRYTKEHIPQWARQANHAGRGYRPQHATDLDWLANTLFTVRNDGRLDMRVHHCASTPTWPDGQGSNIAASVDGQTVQLVAEEGTENQ